MSKKSTQVNVTLPYGVYAEICDYMYRWDDYFRKHGATVATYRHYFGRRPVGKNWKKSLDARWDKIQQMRKVASHYAVAPFTE